MENDRLNEILYRVAESVLERLAFIFSFPAMERDEISLESAAASSVSFSGPFAGSIVLAVTDRALPEIAENMLGLPEGEGLSVEQQHDALKELVNVICGNLLPEIAGKQAVFDFDMPCILSGKIPAEEKTGEKRTSVAKLDLERGRCDVILFANDHIDKYLNSLPAGNE